jgi:predicted alpha/beta hydrolase
MNRVLETRVAPPPGAEPGAAPEARLIPAADGYPLAATLYRGSDQTVVLVNPATGVPHRFYRRFASWLQQFGWTVVTYDYRGIGDSKPASLRGFGGSMRDWAFLDMTAIVDWVSDEWSPRRLFAIGHSFGGQTLGLIENASRIDAMVGISAQSGYWALQGGREPARVRAIVTIIIPVLSRLVGYFPWSWFASGADLPKQVALEWAGWCRQPNYLLDDESLPLERYARFKAPLLAYSIDDDDWGHAARGRCHDAGLPERDPAAHRSRRLRFASSRAHGFFSRRLAADLVRSRRVARRKCSMNRGSARTPRIV